MSDGLLWDEVIVRQEIVHQGLFKFSRAPETGLGRSSLMRPFMRSTMPFVWGWRGGMRRWSMRALAQAWSKK
jgi:hypothetical protein